MTLPVEVGGHGRSPLERFLVSEAMIAAGAPVAASFVGDRQIGPTLVEYGSEEQKRRFVPDIVAGRSCWSIGLSEPDAGSDLAAVRTRAVRDGAHWCINGRKIWTSFAADADFIYLVTRTDPDAPAHRGMSEIIVPLDTPGVSATPIVDMVGERHFCEVAFDDVRVPAENLVGELHGSWRQVMRQLEHERAGIDRLLSNFALYLDVRERADRADPLVRQDIAALEIGLRIGRLLVIRETVGQAPAGFSAATKVFCTELEQRIADFVSRVDPSVIRAPPAAIAGRSRRFPATRPSLPPRRIARAAGSRTAMTAARWPTPGSRRAACRTAGRLRSRPRRVSSVPLPHPPTPSDRPSQDSTVSSSRARVDLANRRRLVIGGPCRTHRWANGHGCTSPRSAASATAAAMPSRPTCSSPTMKVTVPSSSPR